MEFITTYIELEVKVMYCVGPYHWLHIVFYFWEVSAPSFHKTYTRTVYNGGILEYYMITFSYTNYPN